MTIQPTAPAQTAPDHIAEIQQMTAQLPCYEYYSAPGTLGDTIPAPAPAPGVAVLDQMFGYFD